MKSIAIVFIVGVVISSGFMVAAVPNTPNQGPRQTFSDELDQSETNRSGTIVVGAMQINGTKQNFSLAQSFIPQKDVITRVQLLMAKNATTTYNCTCDLKENLTGSTLASVQLTPDQFKVFDPDNLSANENLTWVEFGFFSVWVTPGTTYYLEVYTTNITGNNYVLAVNLQNGYSNGSTFLSLNYGASWLNLSIGDWCFQTYGLRETTLSVTVGGSNLLGPWFTIKNTGNHTAAAVASNITVTGGTLGLVHSFSYKYYEELPQNNQKNVITPFTLGFGRVTITETVSAINAKDQVVTVNATLILFIIRAK